MADETLTVAVEADLSGFDKAMVDLTAKANGFGAAFSAALKGAVSGGRTLDGVLQQLAQRISTLALNAALKPLENALGGVLQGLTGSLLGLFGGGGDRLLGALAGEPQADHGDEAGGHAQADHPAERPVRWLRSVR